MRPGRRTLLHVRLSLGLGRRAMLLEPLVHGDLGHVTGEACHAQDLDVTSAGVERRRLKGEGVQIGKRAASQGRLALKGLQETTADALASIRRSDPKLLEFAAVAPGAANRATDSAA